MDPETHVGLYALAVFVDNRNDFTRKNPDGSQWLHFQDVNALLFIGVWDGNVNNIPAPDEWLFSGSGKVTGSFTTLDSWTADLRRLEYRWDGTLTEVKPGAEEPGAEYPFFLHVVVKNGVFLQEDVRFTPLGLDD